MSEPTPIRKVEKESHPHVIEILETLLAEARRGEIRQIAYIVDYATAYRIGQAGAGDKMQLLGEVTMLVADITQTINEERHPTK